MSIATIAATVYRMFNVSGLPSSGDHEPEKSEIIELFTVVDAALGAIGLSGSVGVIRSSRAILDGYLTPPSDTLALVYADPEPANNDFYLKVGGPGTGTWQKLGLTITPALSGQIAEIIAAYENIDAQVAAAEASAASALASEIDAEAAALAAAAYANAAGISRVFDTKANADAALGSIAADAYIQVLTDETQGGMVTVYQKSGGALVFKRSVYGLTDVIAAGDTTRAPTSDAVYDALLGKAPLDSNSKVPDINLPAYIPAWITPQKVGAVCDGVADDTAKWQECIADGRKIVVPRGTISRATSIVIDQPTTIEFEGGYAVSQGRPTIRHSGGSPLFVLKANDTHIYGGVYIDGETYLPATGANVFQVDLTDNSVQDLTLEDFIAFRTGGILGVTPPDPSDNYQLVFTHLRRWKFYGQRGYGLLLKNVFSTFFTEDLYLEWLRPGGGLYPGESVADINYPMLRVESNVTAGAGGIFPTRTFLQGANRVDCPDNHGIVLIGPGSGLRAQTVDVDGAGGFGLYAEQFSELKGNDLGLNSCWRHAMVLDGVDHVDIAGYRSSGRKGNTDGSTADQFGIWVVGDTKWGRIVGDVSNQTGYAVGWDETSGDNFALEIDVKAANCGADGTTWSNKALVDDEYTDARKNLLRIVGIT